MYRLYSNKLEYSRFFNNEKELKNYLIENDNFLYDVGDNTESIRVINRYSNVYVIVNCSRVKEAIEYILWVKNSKLEYISSKNALPVFNQIIADYRLYNIKKILHV